MYSSRKLSASARVSIAATNRACHAKYQPNRGSPFMYSSEYSWTPRANEGDQPQEHHRQGIDDDAPVKVDRLVNGGRDAGYAGLEPRGREVTGQCAGYPA